MKINILLPTVELCGGVRVMFEYSNRLARRGHDVTIIYPHYHNFIDRNLSNLRVRFRTFFQDTKSLLRDGYTDSVDWFDTEADLLKVPTFASWATPLIEYLIPNADVTICTWWKTAHTLHNIGNKAGEKVYFVNHYEVPELWESESCWEKAEKEADDPDQVLIEMSRISPEAEHLQRKKRLTDRTYDFPFHYIVVSDWVREVMEKTFDNQVVEVIPNSVNTDIFHTVSSVSDADITILTLYRHHNRKGRKEVKALAEYVAELENVDLKIFSPTVPEQALTKMLAGEVDVYHRPSDSSLQELYSQADIFVLPSWMEGWGLPAFEAMACSCAVVATNVGGIRHWITHGETALVSQPRDTDQLLTHVRSLIEDQREIERLKNNGREFVMKYSWDDATDSLEGALETITDDQEQLASP